MKRLVAHVDGHVQGVGFRWWTRSQSVELGLSGSATNLSDGRVRVIAEGPDEAVGELLRRLWSGPGSVTDVTQEWAAPLGESGFDTF